MPKRSKAWLGIAKRAWSGPGGGGEMLVKVLGIHHGEATAFCLVPHAKQSLHEILDNGNKVSAKLYCREPQRTVQVLAMQYPFVLNIDVVQYKGVLALPGLRILH